MMITRPHTRRRTRTRRPRFLSLGGQLAPPPTSPESTVQTAFGGGDDCRKQEQKREQQLGVFPLHPEFEVRAKEEEEEEPEDDDDSPPSSRFFVDPEFGANATLASLLGATATTSSSVAVEERESLSASPSPSPSVNYGLARAALRGRERWVFCHEEEDEGEASSGKSGGGGMADIWRNGEPPRGMLCLKLDYEEVLTAWSDKGSLYIEGEGPQIVPYLHHPHHHHQTLYVDVGGGANTSSSSSSSLWTVTENTYGNCSLEMSKTNGSRKERVMRYREKRQTRLFSKKIRYEVRKLNAEKRPRIKGRFVKRMMEEVA